MHTLGENVQITDITRESDGDVQEMVVTITADADEVNAFIDKQFKELAKNEIPGFRKGKAPREVLEREAGGHDVVFARIAENIVNEAAPAQLDDADVIFIGDPHFNIEKIPTQDQPFTFSVSGPVPPTCTLSSYDEVSIDMPPNEATDSEVQQQIDELLSVYYSYEVIDDPSYAIEDGDFVTVRMTITSSNGSILPGLDDVERMIGIGGGSMPESFDEHLIGAKLGYTLDFGFEAISDKERPELGDGNLHANVEIKEIRKRIIPDIDDDFLAKVGATSEEDLRKQMRMTINMQKDREMPKLLEQRVVDALVERFEGEVPEYYFEFMRDNVSRELMQRLQQEGTGLQDWMLKNNIEAEKMQNEVKLEAIDRAKRDMALEALFAEKGWEVTDEDIERELSGVDDAQATIAELQAAHRMADLRKMCRQSMAARWLARTADITVIE